MRLPPPSPEGDKRMVLWATAICAAILAFSVLSRCAFGQDAPRTKFYPPSPLHDWFERQHSVKGDWCCNISDGHKLDSDAWRIVNGRYEALAEGRWWPIEDDKLVDPRAGGPNPTGHAVLWYSVTEYGVQIYCFAPGILN